MITFTLTGDYIELNKLLKVTNLCSSGGEANQVIVAGLVSVDGEKETRKRRKVTRGQAVKYKGKTVQVV